MPECNELLRSYFEWLRTETVCTQDEGFLEITTPFIDRHNDYIQIYVERTSSGLRLTDDGYTIHDLEMYGCNLDTPKRVDMLESILRGFAIRRQGTELFTEATQDAFAERKHALIQAILAVEDLFMTAPQTVSSLFVDDVERFLRSHDIRFTSNLKFTGISGFDYKFDFVIPESGDQPERIINAISSPSRNRVTNLIFAWTDTRSARKTGTKLYAILNDTDRPIAEDFVSAFVKYDIDPVPWSQRQSRLDSWAS
jgi:hypothetical protein